MLPLDNKLKLVQGIPFTSLWFFAKAGNSFAVITPRRWKRLFLYEDNRKPKEFSSKGIKKTVVLVTRR